MNADDFIWKARTFVYTWFAEHARAPEVRDLAERFDISHDQAGQALRALHERHALFLEPGTVKIRMANPFSAIATPFTVVVQGKTYWANCAWDCFGIPVALQAAQASIESTCAASGARIHLDIAAGRVVSAGEVAHFLVPFRHWYDDLVVT
jgi:DNA-binding transcriptional MocR family regulator